LLQRSLTDVRVFVPGRLLKVRAGCVEVALTGQDCGGVEMGLAEIGAEAESFFEGFQGCVGLAGEGQECSFEVLGFGVFGVRLHCGFGLLKRFIKALESC
jgi:hypothetical protein